MMHRHNQHMLLISNADQLHAKQPITAEIKRPIDLLPDHPFNLLGHGMRGGRLFGAWSLVLLWSLEFLSSVVLLTEEDGVWSFYCCVKNLHIHDRPIIH